MLHFTIQGQLFIRKGHLSKFQWQIQIQTDSGAFVQLDCWVPSFTYFLLLFLIFKWLRFQITYFYNVCTILLQCVGTDRNIPDVVLDTRITTLFRLLRFYHLDFETLSIKAKDTFSEKLHQVFETYLPILQYSSNIFGSIPTFNLPKVIILL